MQKRVKQLRAMPRRQHEAVAVRPIGMRRIMFEKLREQDGRHIGGTERHAGMARLGLFHRVHRERADGVGHVPVLGVTLFGGCG